MIRVRMRDDDFGHGLSVDPGRFHVLSKLAHGRHEVRASAHINEDEVQRRANEGDVGGGGDHVGALAEPILDLTLTHIAGEKPSWNGHVPVANDTDLECAELEGVAGC